MGASWPPKGSNLGPKMGPSWPPNGSKNRSKNGRFLDQCFTVFGGQLGPFLGRFWDHFGALGGVLFDIFLKRSEKHEDLKIRQPSHTLGLFLGFPRPSGRHFSTPVGVIFRILFGSRFGCVLGAIFDGFLIDFGRQMGAELGPN